MILKAFPKPGEPVRAPGHAIPVFGQPVRLAGMKFDYDKKDHVPSGKACEVDDTADGAREFRKAIAQGHLLAADADTAAAAGVPFVEVDVDKDGWAKPKHIAKSRKGEV